MARFALIMLDPPGFEHAGIFAEVIETLQHGLRALGHEAVMARNTCFADCINVLFAAHLLPYFPGFTPPPGSVIFNLEPVIPQMLERLRDYPALLRQPGAPMARRHADDLVFYATLGIILGGRIGYVLFYQPDMILHPLSIFALWEGGMSFHGGAIGTAIAVWWLARRNRSSTMSSRCACCCRRWPGWRNRLPTLTRCLRAAASKAMGTALWRTSRLCSRERITSWCGLSNSAAAEGVAARTSAT